MTMSDDLESLLEAMKLRALRAALVDELARAERESPGYREFLSRLLHIEHEAQMERFMEYRVAREGIPEQWSLSTYPWDKQPGADRRVIEQLASLDFVRRGENVVLIGPTGVGKTGIASALLLKALHAGMRGLFVKAQDLFDEVYASLADRGTPKLLERLLRYDVLLIDEMSYLNLRSEQTNIFFKLMHERHLKKKTTLITTNLDYDSWFDFLGRKDMVEALLSRLRNRCVTLRIDGPSLRAQTG
jgi:DNA replication protein DnaC